jgi:branched-subunit amino acid aminotransferase/4-amino-4-deoxychorismate lyase
MNLDKYGFPVSGGIFTTTKTIDGDVVALNRHMRRVTKSCMELGIEIPSEEIIRKEIAQLLNDSPSPVGRLRLCFFNGGHHFTHTPYVETPPPVRVTFSSETFDLKMAEHKLFPYDRRLEIRKSAQNEAFEDAIIFNQQNEVSETATSNLILLINGEWTTPPISSGVLPGVIRGIAIEECGVKVAKLHITEIPDVTSAFLTSSLKIALPISHIGDYKLEIGAPSHQLEAQIRAKALPESVS